MTSRLFEPASNPPSSGRAPRRTTQLEHESHYHRLSRFPDRYSAKPAPLQDHPDDLTPFATNYFKQNPEAQDLSTPEAKLESINTILTTALTTPQRFTYLTQKKTMVYLIHGEESSEMHECLKLLGVFYAENSRPESAIRHLQQAQRLEEQAEVSDEDSRAISLLLAESHMKVDAKRKQHLAAAEAAIERFADDEPDDAPTKARLALVRARILKEKGEFDASSEQYTIALDGVAERDEPTAQVHVEAAEAYEGASKFSAAADSYKTARDIFAELNMDDAAAGLDAKIAATEEQAEHQLEESLTEAFEDDDKDE
jgi:tetratricopeptide (TPR) repeat protein